MLTDIFAARYSTIVIWERFGEKERRLLVQTFKLLDEQVCPYYINGKESAMKEAFDRKDTRNTLMAAFRNVMKVVRDDGLITVVPDTPRVTVRDNPRPFFRFRPLVTDANDEYKKLLAGAKKLAAQNTIVRGIPVTEELYDLIPFTVHSFVRPMTTELYAEAPVGARVPAVILP